MADYERFELIEGVLIPKMPKNHPPSVALVVIVHRDPSGGAYRSAKILPPEQ